MTARRAPLLMGAVLLAALLAHAPATRFEFVLDDHQLIVHNRFLREDWSAARALGHHFFHGSAGGSGYYRPAVVASFAINGRATGWSATGFHAANVLIHAANALLLFLLARRLGARDPIAALAAAVFAAHPATSWSVASIAARVDLLAGTFLLLGWLTLAWTPGDDDPAVGSREEGASGAAAGGGRRMTARTVARAGAAGAAFLGALLCKESAVAFLAPLLITPRPERRRGWAAATAPILACGAAFALYSGLRRAAGIGVTLPLDRIDPITNPLPFLPAADRLPAALGVAGRHLAYLFRPVRFSDPRGYGPAEATVSLVDPWAIGAAIGIAAWVAAVVLLWRRRHAAAAPLAFALAAFLPASNLLVPIASLYSVNYLYLPLVGVCLALATTLERAPAVTRWMSPDGPRRPAVAIAAGLIAVLGAATVLEARAWRDDVALMRHWTVRFPRHAIGHAGLGSILIDQGRDTGAIEPLRTAIALDGRGAAAHYNLGLALARTSRDPETLREALRHTETAIARSYDLVPAYVNAGRILLLLGRHAGAETASREALRSAPGYPPARMNLASALFRQGRYNEAASVFAGLARDLPRDVSVRFHFITSLLLAGTPDEARREAFRARREFPDSGRFDFVLARIEARSGRGEAFLYLRTAVDKDPGMRDWIEREEDFATLRGRPEYAAIVAPGQR